LIQQPEKRPVIDVFGLVGKRKRTQTRASIKRKKEKFRIYNKHEEKLPYKITQRKLTKVHLVCN